MMPQVSERANSGRLGADPLLCNPCLIQAKNKDERDGLDISGTPADLWLPTMGRSRARHSRGTSRGAGFERPLSH